MKSSSSKPGVQGEGDYVSAKKYNQSARSFAESGKAEQAAKDAAPRDAREQEDMRRAEAEGRSHAKGTRSDTASREQNRKGKPEGEHPDGNNPVPKKIPGR